MGAVFHCFWGFAMYQKDSVTKDTRQCPKDRDSKHDLQYSVPVTSLARIWSLHPLPTAAQCKGSSEVLILWKRKLKLREN